MISSRHELCRLGRMKMDMGIGRGAWEIER